MVNDDDILEALDIAYKSFKEWNHTDVSQRSKILLKAADLLESRMSFFVGLISREAGRVIKDGVSEVREAVDFLRYYASTAEKDMAPLELPAVTGSENNLYLEGKGVFLCISPWNFPLAIFLGQVSAALVTGNTVLAKPADPTNIIACEAIKVLLEAGIPASVLHLLPGKGSDIGRLLLEDDRVSGVVFTGSTEVAQHINTQLSNRNGPIPTFIAETGGINAMVVDSSAMLEQVTKSVISSAFYSAGQRCSALRVLYIQEDIAKECIEMIVGAMKELNLGTPKEFCNKYWSSKLIVRP